MLFPAAACLDAFVCALCGPWQSCEQDQSMRPGPVCSACVGVLWVCLWCGNTPQNPEYRQYVAAGTTSGTAEERYQQQFTTHTAPSTKLKLHPTSPPPHEAVCLFRPSRGLRLGTDSPIGPCARLDSLVGRGNPCIMPPSFWLLLYTVR